MGYWNDPKDSPPATKVFDGVKYSYYTTMIGKRQAQSVAKKFREPRGREKPTRVRVVYGSGNAYHLYMKF